MGPRSQPRMVPSQRRRARKEAREAEDPNLTLAPSPDPMTRATARKVERREAKARRAVMTPTLMVRSQPRKPKSSPKTRRMARKAERKEAKAAARVAMTLTLTARGSQRVMV